MLLQIANGQTAIFDRLEQVLTAIINSGTGATSATFNSYDDIVVAVAGTAVQGPNVALLRGVWITARDTNTGQVYLGGSGVTNGAGAQRGMTLVPAGMNSSIIPISNLNQIWINADNAGDRVGIIAL